MDLGSYDNLGSTDKHSEITIEFSLFDKSIEDLEKRLSNVSKIISFPDANLLICDLSNLSIHILFSIKVLQRVGHEEELEFWKRYLDISQRWFQKKVSKPRKDIVLFLFGIVPALAANCLVELNQFDEALTQLIQLHEQPLFRQREVNEFYNDIEGIAENPDTDVPLSLVLVGHFIAGCVWFKMKDFEKSLDHLQISFGLILSIEPLSVSGSFYLRPFNMPLSSHVVYFNGIGSCFMEMKQYENALVFFELAFKLAIDDGDSNDNDSHDDGYGGNDVKNKNLMLPESFLRSASFLNLSSCLMKLQKFDKAFVCMNKALELSAD